MSVSVLQWTWYSDGKNQIKSHKPDLYFLRTSPGFLLEVNNVSWCPPTSLDQGTQGMPREQEEQFAHSQPRHGGFGRMGSGGKTPNIQNPSLRAIM